jgi:hypothetical protein
MWAKMSAQRIFFRLAVLTAFILVFASALCSQTTGKVNSYSEALTASIREMERQWGHLRQGVDYQHVIVEKDSVPTDDLPTSVEGRSIEYLDQNQLIERYLKLNKSFEILRVGPIVNDGNQLKITVSTYSFSYKKKRQRQELRFGFSDWSEVHFRFDCEKQQFVIASVKLGGI